MNKTYCISDLHGHFNIFMECLKRIDFCDNDHLYILGDCNDKGPSTFELYEYIFAHSNNIHLIKGNHELMLKDFLLSSCWDTPDGRLYAANGGKKTIEQIKTHFTLEQDYHSYIKKLINKIENLPNYIEISIDNKDYVLIHSGINPEKDLYSQNEEECCWMREYFYLSKGLSNKTIVFGHTPTKLIESETNGGIWIDDIYEDKIGIDGGLGSFKDGQLNCLCLNDMSVTVIKKKEIEE